MKNVFIGNIIIGLAAALSLTSPASAADCTTGIVASCGTGYIYMNSCMLLPPYPSEATDLGCCFSDGHDGYMQQQKVSYYECDFNSPGAECTETEYLFVADSRCGLAPAPAPGTSDEAPTSPPPGP